MSSPRSTPPLISLIMPVWQPRRDWLSAAIASALAQSDCRIELIVVEDGCDGAARDLCGSTDSRLRFVTIAHGGPSAARNAGIAASRGAWLRFVDADDVLPMRSTRHLADSMDGDRVIAYGATLVCDESLAPRGTIASTMQGDVVAACLAGRFTVRHPSMLFPRSVVEAAGRWDESFPVSGDWDFVLRALEHAKVRGDDAVATHYRRHQRSISRSASLAAGESARHRLIGKYFDRHPEQRGGPLERDALSALYMDRGRAYWDAHEYRQSLNRFSSALQIAPFAGARGVASFLGTRVRRRVARVAQPAAW